MLWQQLWFFAAMGCFPANLKIAESLKTTQQSQTAFGELRAIIERWMTNGSCLFIKRDFIFKQAQCYLILFQCLVIEIKIVNIS